MQLILRNMQLIDCSCSIVSFVKGIGDKYLRMMFCYRQDHATIMCKNYFWYNTHMEIKINEYTPSEMREHVSRDADARGLILSGYDFTEAALKEPTTATLEFSMPDERGTVYVAQHEGRAVGSLSVVIWTPEANEGRSFWSRLQELDPTHGQRAAEINPLAVNVWGMVVHPDMRKQGIGRQLYQRMVDDLNPSVIVGKTRTPGAVAARSRLSAYRTFYGTYETTDETSAGLTRVHVPVVQAYHKALDRVADRQTLTFTVENSDLVPTPPQLAGYPEHIRRAFVPVREAQARNPLIPVMAPLVSIHRLI
jgi:GNAT superfamily N-acetyltransferase